MLISYKWIASLLGADPGAEAVAQKLTLVGLETESVTHVGAHLAAVRVARVLSARAHPTSKNPLTLVTVDVGGRELEVVCGAPNVPAAGGLVCFAPVGARVFDKKGNPFVLEAKPVAGIVSQGMLCAEDELKLGTGHDGILILDGGAPGQSLLEYEPRLEDWILEINVTPNRPDALGHRGVARDAGAALRLAYEPREPAAPAARGPAIGDAVRVRLDDAERCPRYCAALVRGVTVGPSPLWVRARLQALGVRPINNVVDVTNLVMLEYGQPLHGFDQAHIGGRTIVVRRAHPDEMLQTLDGATRPLNHDDLVIADAERALAIAGVMGGEGSGITSATRDVVLESAYFEPRGVRRTARRHGMHTDASHRFERGTDITAAPRALARAVALLAELAGGTPASDGIDEMPKAPALRTVRLRPARATELLGVEISPDEMKATLAALQFGVSETTPGTIDAVVPFHRPDVSREVDLIEEVGRIHGFDTIRGKVPPSAGARAGARGDFWLRRRVREVCTALGLDEALSYAFVAADELVAAGFTAEQGVKLKNPLSEERSVMRPTLLSRLFAATVHAVRYGAPRVRLFEVATTFAPDGAPEPGLARETTRVALVLAGPRDTYLARPADVDFYDGKGAVEALVEALTGVAPRFHTDAPPPAWAHPRAYAHVDVDGTRVGTVALPHPDVRARMDLPRGMVAAELETAPLATRRRAPVARAPGRHPTMRRDVALLVARTHPAGAIAATLHKLAGALCESVELFDRYEGKELPEGTHSLAFALRYRADERTLTDAEVDALTDAAVKAARAEFGAEQR